AYQVLRMAQGIVSADADARAGRIRDDSEDVFHITGAIGVGDGLHGQRAASDHKVVLAAGDLLGDGIAGRQIVLSVVAADRDVLTVDEAGGGESVQHTGDAFIEYRLRRMLQDRDLRYMTLRSRALVPV